MQANPGSSVISGNSVVTPKSQSKPKRKRGTSARACTSLFQASLGVALMVTGVIVLSVGASFEPRYRRYSYYYRTIDDFDKISCGVWCGALSIFAAAFGLFRRRNQVVISLYMAFSIFVSLLALFGIIWSCIALSYLASNIVGLEEDSYKNLCKPGRYVQKIANASQECIPEDYCSEPEECCVTMQEIDSCIEKTRSKLITHLVWYGIMLICFVVEFVVSVVGASYTCVGLDCCRRTPRQIVYYQSQAPQLTGQLGQPVVLSPQQYPVGLPPPAGAPMVQIAPMVQQTSPPQDEYLIPDAPIAYQRQINQRNYDYASAPPSYEDVNQGGGNGSNNEPQYIAVV